jgi:hypothetical protein
MSLLRLSPEGERLRRIARAHAAGEMSTPDYRRIRGDVIEGYAIGDVDLVGDDTQQRCFEQPTAQLATPEHAPAPVPTARPARSTRKVWVVVSGALLLAMALGMAAAWGLG